MDEQRGWIQAPVGALERVVCNPCDFHGLFKHINVHGNGNDEWKK